MSPHARPRGLSRWWVLASLVVALGVAPLGGLAYLVETQATSAVRAESRNSLSSTTSLMALFLGEQLGGVEHVMESYAKRPALRRALHRALATPDGDTSELTRQMFELRESRSDVLNVAGIADTAGRMIAGTVMPPQPIDFSERDWHRGVMRTRQSYVSEAIVGASPGSPLAIAIATPVLDGRGQVEAIVVVGYTLENFQQFVENFAGAQGIDVTVTDQRGVVIAQPGEAPTSLVSTAEDPRVRSALAGDRGVAEGDRNAAGEVVLSAYSPVPGIGWTVLAELPRDRAYAQVARLQSTVVLITVLLALLMVLGGALLARTIRSRDLARQRAERLASINSAVLEASREGVSLFDAENRPLLRNAMMEELRATLGMGPGGDPYEQMVRLAPAMEDPEKFAAAATALGSDEDLVLTDEFTVRSSGRSFQRYSRPIVSTEGEMLGRLFVLRETTAERQSEAAVRRARDDAESANAAKTDFLSRMSHELRTPLHAILGFGELLERAGLEPEQREMVQQMTSGGRHLLDLINEVLDLSRIERGELSMSVEPVQVGSVVEEVLALITPLTAVRSITVRAPGTENLDVHVQADRQRLKQVLLNLVSNAVKYNRVGGEVGIIGWVTDAGMLRLEVSDTGPGIAPDKRHLVFDEFERLGAEASNVEGAGLGLALSKRLVEAMGGRIDVTSEPGQGATFWLELPVTAAPDLPDVVMAPRARTVQGDGHGPARTVLLVEDNPSNIKLVETILAQRPAVELIVATQGGAALELARRHRPALVLLDLNLPDMSGRDVLQLLRSDERTAGLRVVMVSADATPSEIERLMAAGADDYLTKPFRLEEFLELVDGSGELRGTGPTAELPTKVLDVATVQALKELAGNPNVGRAALQDLLQVFFDDASTRLELLADAVRDRDAPALQSQAHALRGGSSGIGAFQVAALCRHLEGAGVDGDFDAAEQAVAGLRDALLSARAALAREFGIDSDVPVNQP